MAILISLCVSSYLLFYSLGRIFCTHVVHYDDHNDNHTYLLSFCTGANVLLILEKSNGYFSSKALKSELRVLVSLYNGFVIMKICFCLQQKGNKFMFSDF